MKKLILLFTLTFSFSSIANILIEPYFGMALNGSWEDGNSDGDYASAGSTYGARLGYQSMGLQLGVDWRNFSADLEVDGQDDSEYSHNPMYAFIGYEFPVLFRIYAQMAISGEGEVKDGNTYTGMDSTIIGLSYSGLPFIAINFEMVNYAWDEFETQGGATGDSELEASHYLLSLSLPISL